MINKSMPIYRPLRTQKSRKLNVKHEKNHSHTELKFLLRSKPHTLIHKKHKIKQKRQNAECEQKKKK